MRIGIVTQPLCANYGGILQNLALQRVLKDLGHVPITLDLCTHLNVSKATYIKGYIIHFIKCLLSFRISKYLSYKQKRPSVFDVFVSKYIDTTDIIDSYSSELIEKYNLDCIIVGSDQVWRPRFNVFPEDMFLSFTEGVNIKRLSYAASFGVNNWEYSPELTNRCKDLVAHFDGVSVREDSAIKLCETYLKVTAQLVLDPTLLLPSSFYDSLCSEVSVRKDRFIAVYTLDIPENVKKEISIFAFNHGMTVKSFTSDANYSLSIPEWISVFRDASFVITDSFHGTAFSIIYHKDFITLSNDNRGEARVLSLLNQFGLSDRLCDTSTSDFTKISSMTINWGAVEEKRDSLMHNSLSFMKRYL